MSSPRVAGLLMGLGLQGVVLSLMARWSFLAREPEPFLFAGFGVLAGLFYALNLWLVGNPLRGRTIAGQLPLVIWGSAILFRLALLPAEPGDDIWRYLWEGAIQWRGHNPYLLPPDDPVFAGLRAELPYAWRIGHASWPAIYPPLTQIVLALSAAISNTVIFQKLLYAAADLATMFLVGRLFREQRGRLLGLALYGWNPLLIVMFAGHAHFDSLMLLPLVGAVVLTQKFLHCHEGRMRSPRLAMAIGALLGLAISIKALPVALLPVFALALGRVHWRFCVPLGLAVALPVFFSILYGYPAIPIYDNLRFFAAVTRTNDLLWWISERFIWSNPWRMNEQYNDLSLLLAFVLALVFRRDFSRALLWIIGLLLLLSPALHPWYVTWILPFAIWRRSVFWITFSVSVFAYFLLWQNSVITFAWEQGNWLLWALQVGPAVLVAVLWKFLVPTPDLVQTSEQSY